MTDAETAEGQRGLGSGEQGCPLQPGSAGPGAGGLGESLECVNREHPKATTKGPLA